MINIGMTDVTYHKIYSYENVRQVLALGDVFCFEKDNGPMNFSTIKCHKGVDNRLVFRALGPDRTPFDIAHNEQVYARFIDPDNRTIVLEKLCRLGPAKGIITVLVDSGDIALIHAGLYELVLIRTQEFVSGVPDYYIEKPLYSDLNNNISMQVEITEQAFKAPLPSIVYTPKDWTPSINISTFGPPIPSFYTGRIPGARILNHVDSVHSFSTYTENFTGILELWGSLEETPDPFPTVARWFKIYPSSMAQDIEYINYTGTSAWTFSENLMWIKFRMIPSTEVLDPGVLAKLIIRV